MKMLVAAAAIVVIATCGYFVYDDVRAKRLAEQRIEFLKCRESLRQLRRTFEKMDMLWDYKTAEARLEVIDKTFGAFVADVFASDWKKCGPI